MNTKIWIGQQIRQIRNRLELRQRPFVELFNSTEPVNVKLTVVNLCKYETGRTKVSAEVYLKILSMG